MESIAYITSRKKQYDLKDIEARRTKLDKKDLPKNISSFLNDEGYVNKTVDDLVNYYTKSETYSKEEVQELISTRILIKIVDKLPESNISTSTIYFLKRPEEDLPQSQYQSDVYDEYIYVDATWELIGNTYVDLTPYYTKEEVEIVIDDKILEERLIRENAEFTLQNNIDALEQKTDSEITQIKQINLNQDNSISTLETNLQNEITRATNKENELSDRSDNFDSHIENNDNPHNVNKTQIGLDNVENLPIDDVPTLNSRNYVKSGGVFNALENKIDKVEGKGLSDENFTYEEKIKLSNLKNYDDTEIVNNINENTSAINILNSDSTVDGSVDNKIKNAILDVAGLQFNVVEELPSVGENGVIYFVLNSIIEDKNYYDEYIWLNNKFELLGQTITEIDLSNYHTKAEINALLSSKLNKGYKSATDANDAIGEHGVNVFILSHTSANLPVGRTGVIRSFSYVQDNYIRVNQEFSTIDNSPQNGGTYKRYGVSDDGGETFTWSNWNFIASIDDSTTDLLKTWSSSKIASEIVGKKTEYRGSRSVDIDTGGKLTFIFSSTYSTSAGCYILLSNYNTTPTLIKLGGHPEEKFKVTAVNKSNSVDTITVTIPNAEYSWYVLQF